MDPANLVNISIAVLVGAIVWAIVRSVRQVNAQIEGKLRGVDPRKREALMREMTARIRSQATDMRCPRCNGSVFAMLDRESWWKCHSCHHEFEGLEHLPMPEGTPESGHPTGA